MKSQKKIIILSPDRPNTSLLQRGQIALGAFAILLALTFWTGCNSANSTEELPIEDEIKTEKVHIAFAGGGWLAHTGHSAWIMSLLDNNSGDNVTTLDDAFKNVNIISSNSGGSWFSTMLMYSGPFVEDIQATKAIENWASTGWIGQQKKHFNAATYKHFLGHTHPCSHHLGSDPGKFEEAEYIDCIADYYAGTPYYWKKTIESLVFRDYSLGSIKLNDPKQPWARGKSLLIASTLLNNSVVLNSKEELRIPLFQRYYQACLQDSINPHNMPILEGDEHRKTTRCSDGLPKDVAAVTFTSLAAGSKLNPLPFLRELDSESSLYNIGYTKNLSLGADSKDNTVKHPLHHGDVPVMTAAAASSAAAGFVASEHFTKVFDVAYAAEDLALSFKLGDSTVQFVDTDGMSFDDLVDNKVVRLADGGPVDNSGVAQIVSFLQKNNQAVDFNIVAFDNVAKPYPPGGTGAKVGIDIASLFGAPDPFSDTIVIKIPWTKRKEKIPFTVETPDLQIFVADTMNNTPITWSHPASNGQQIFYTKYNVKTIQNEALGVASGSTGTLHAFTFASSSASIIPDKGDADFKVYSDMLKYIHGSLNANNGKGLNYLRQAFGVPAAK